MKTKTGATSKTKRKRTDRSSLTDEWLISVPGLRPRVPASSALRRWSEPTVAMGRRSGAYCTTGRLRKASTEPKPCSAPDWSNATAWRVNAGVLESKTVRPLMGGE
jgi:hypothetical protein